MSTTRSAAFWKKRAEAGMLYVQAQADRRLDIIGTAAHQASTYLAEEAQKIFRTFAGRFDLTEEEARAELSKPITRAEYDSLLSRIATLPEGEARTQLEIRANSGAYGYRISRAEALRENIAVETARLAQVEYNQLTAQLNETATEGYGMRMFNIQQQTGRAFHVPNMDAARVSIDTPWFGQSYSQRIWGERDDLADILEKEITAGYLSGKSHRKIAAEISERFEVSYDDAVRLVRTETSHISNQADLVAYRDADVHRYEYDAALDNRTCPICGKMDGKVFDVEKAVEGENFPPMHPHCRCTSLARVDGDDASEGMRRGRDVDGKSVLLPRDMIYEEWKEWQKAGAPGDIASWRVEVKEGLNRGYTYGKLGIGQTVSLPGGEQSTFDGWERTKAKIIAGNGVERDIDDVTRLIAKYGGSVKTWEKVKRQGYVVMDDTGERVLVDFHWYQEAKRGIVERKIKVDDDGEYFYPEA